jgi:hypothetical protein
MFELAPELELATKVQSTLFRDSGVQRRKRYLVAQQVPNPERSELAKLRDDRLSEVGPTRKS